MRIKGRGLLLVAACGLVQSVFWFVLGLLGILVFTCSIDLPEYPDAAALFGTHLAKYYIAGDDCAEYNRTLATWMTPPEGVLIINCIVLASSCLWTIASILLIWEAVRVTEERRHWVLWCWVGITAFICLSDLGIFINFSVDYSNTVSRMRALQVLGHSMNEYVGYWPNPMELLTYPAFMMAMAARGYILWLLNIAAALWVGFEALGGGCSGDEQDERASLKHHFLTSLYSDRQDKFGGVSAPWAVQSPVVGTAPRPPPWTSSTYESPTYAPPIEIPRPFRLAPPPPGRPRPNNGAGASASASASSSAIPEPDYDRESLSLSREPPPQEPPHAKDALRRQPPPLDEMPRRSALKKAAPAQSRLAGKTVF